MQEMKQVSLYVGRLRLPVLPQAPVLGLGHFGQGLAVLMVSLMCLFAWLAAPKAVEHWRWMDIAGEGGMALMAGVWLVQVRSSRPAGRVTSLLCLGLASVLLGQWVDLLDEFWVLPKAVIWDNWLESTLVPLGTLLLTWGLHHWRHEQQSLTAQMLKRERLFREHRSLDGVTQLGDARYLAAQIAIEQRLHQPAALAMLGLDGFDAVARTQGLAESDRLLQAASHLLLLNLRPDDLLCRYAADRFCVLMPGLQAGEAQARAEHLRQALSMLAHHTRAGTPLQLPARSAVAAVDAREAPDAQLLALARRLAEAP
jgi:diguanylate cyclase (GGDEF)-like protein